MAFGYARHDGLCPQCAHNANGPSCLRPFTPINIGRDAGIRTRDPLTPSEVLETLTDIR